MRRVKDIIVGILASRILSLIQPEPLTLRQTLDTKWTPLEKRIMPKI